MGRLHFDSGLSASKLTPLKHRHTQIYSSRIHGVEMPVKFKFLRRLFLLSNVYHVKGKGLKDLIVPQLIRLRKGKFIDRRTPESKMMRTSSMSYCIVGKFYETSAAKKLSKHHHEQLVPIREGPAKGTVIDFATNRLKYRWGKNMVN